MRAPGGALMSGPEARAGVAGRHAAAAAAAAWGVGVGVHGGEGAGASVTGRWMRPERACRGTSC